MDAIAETAQQIEGIGRVHSRPTASIQPPCLVVGYPDGDFDLNTTARRGFDRAEFAAWWVLGRRTERTLADDLAPKILALKNGLDGDLGGAVDMCNVKRARIEPVVSDGVEYLAVRLTLDVVS